MTRKSEEEAARAAVRQQHQEALGIVGSLVDGPQQVVTGRSTSTGVVSLDAALDGPLPSGVIEIYGEASTGKTSLLYEVLATAQRSNMMAALCAGEYLDLPYMKKIGVNLSDLILITGNNGEDVLEAATDLLYDHTDSPVVLAIDSATSLRPVADVPGRWLNMIDNFLECGQNYLSHQSAIIMVNQVRTKRSVDPRKFFVDGAVDSTARKIIDQLCLRLELSRGASRENEHEMRVDIVTSAVSKPATTLCIPFSQESGIDTMKDLLLFGLDLGVVQKAGAWYNVNTPDGPLLLGCGMKEAVADLEEHEGHAARLLDLVMVKA